MLRFCGQAYSGLKKKRNVIPYSPWFDHIPEILRRSWSSSCWPKSACESENILINPLFSCSSILVTIRFDRLEGINVSMLFSIALIKPMVTRFSGLPKPHLILLKYLSMSTFLSLKLRMSPFIVTSLSE